MKRSSPTSHGVSRGAAKRQRGAASSSSSSEGFPSIKLEVNESAVDRDRVRHLSGPTEPAEGDCVVYWMSRDQRVKDNWALLYAQEIAISKQLPLAVIFSVVPTFLDATIRQFKFMLRGLEETEDSLVCKGIPFFLLSGNPVNTIPTWCSQNKPALLVCDFSPLRVSRQWKEDVGAKIPSISMQEVDAHNIVPCWMASPKIEYAARTIRPKITRQLDRFLIDFPELVSPHPYAWGELCDSKSKAKNVGAGAVKFKSGSSTDWEAVTASLQVDRSVPEVTWLDPGERAALAALDDFLENRLRLYGSRNDPTQSQACSNLSPYLHFGQLSAQRAALSANRKPSMNGARDSFFEELVIRRELTDNYCFYNRDGYDKLDGLYPQYNNESWAQKSLRQHESDEREYVYSQEEFEKGKTHDELWNAAQLEMVHKGKMHGFLRMYWAKKILEWSPTPSQALDTAIWLNDKYELDGRDPNGYVGCAWAIAGLHDQGWREREVFGKVRYMNYEGCKRKFNVKRYVMQIAKLAAKAAVKK